MDLLGEDLSGLQVKHLYYKQRFFYSTTTGSKGGEALRCVLGQGT